MSQKLFIKAQKSITGGWFYIATQDKTTTCYSSFEAARQYGWKKLKRMQKEASAFAMISQISVNLLSVKDAELVNKLKNTKCASITPRQYGYLKGIYERQERAW
jgi:hypothetical protein